MASGKIIWTGLLCCLLALGVKLFPEAAYRLGADGDAVWLVFTFGLFLIIVGGLFSARHDQR